MHINRCIAHLYVFVRMCVSTILPTQTASGQESRWLIESFTFHLCDGTFDMLLNMVFCNYFEKLFISMLGPLLPILITYSLYTQFA